MVKVGQKVTLSVESQEDGKKKTKVRTAAVCIYVHPKNRFALFDFGWGRECFTEKQLEGMGVGNEY